MSASSFPLSSMKGSMVQLMKSGGLRPETETAPYRDKMAVKVEIEDALEDEHGPLNKRSKHGFHEWSDEADVFPIPPSQYNPLDEPSPLGLRLRKSPSLLDLIQMKLSQASASSVAAVQSESCNSMVKKENKGTASGTADKLKASNFPASLLKIGCWEYKSRYEGDLVAKCYFAKHKLVWEVLDGGLKSKIEIQWSDIMALTANCPDNGPSTLTVVLARQPLFFRETNPQPRKHTLWQATADFTDGQASIYKQHFVQCPQGLLSKHFEKLIQCDMRLNFLSRQPEMPLDSPYFEQRASVFEDPEASKTHCFDQSENSKGSLIFPLSNGASPSAQSSSLKIEQQDSSGMVLDRHSQEAPSPSSVIDSRAIEGTESPEVVNSRSTRNLEQVKVPGLHTSMSMSDLVNHIGNCISEQMTSSNPSFQGEGSEYQNMLEDIAQYLLSDNQLATASDEKSLMTRVNSLCCLLQKDPSVKISQGEYHTERTESEKNVKQGHFSESMDGGNIREGIMGYGDDVRGIKQAAAMSRKDSFGELLLHLPRIASLPKFLFNISEEDGDSQDR